MAEYPQWLPIASSLVGGGFAGAVLTNIVSAYRARRQPIGKRVDTAPLFTPGFIGSALRPSIAVSDGTQTHTFANLHVADVTVVNRGNSDFSSFRFGLTLGPNDSCVHVEAVSSDRHHVAAITPPVTPATPVRTFDVVLEPFNRADGYTFKVFVVAAGEAPQTIEMSSPEAIRFIDMPSFTETVSAIASTAAVRMGPFTLSIGR